MKQIKNIIIEEVLGFLNAEGVGDKYAERKFGIPDEENQVRSQSLSGIKEDDMGTLIGETDGIDKSKIYKNPKNLKNFESNVRAISDEKGDLYVAQRNGSFVHSGISDIINDNVYNIGYAYNNYYMHMLLHRKGFSNNFGVSDTYEMYTVEHPDFVKELIKVAKIKNPQFNFFPVIWDSESIP